VGGAFLVLGLICAATSLAPIALIPRIGGRWTIVAGTLVLAAGFLLASTTRSLATFYIAAGLFGLAFSLIANATGTYLIASWFGPRSPRMIGLYMMVGTLGGAIGPPISGALIASGGGWRLDWLVMAGTALLIAVFCAILIREPPAATGKSLGAAKDDPSAAAGIWGFREFWRTPQFIIIAVAMVATQACIVTVSGVTAPHLAKLGWSAGLAARILGLQGLVGTAATGISGWLTERHDPKRMLVAGLLAEALGMVLLAFAQSPWMIYVFVPAFGIGWSVTSLAITVLLIRYFGNTSGIAALSTIWLLAGVATAGPYAAGLVADATGTFVPALSFLGLTLLPVAFAAFAMNSVRRALPG
jgi:cyanate permease